MLLFKSIKLNKRATSYMYVTAMYNRLTFLWSHCEFGIVLDVFVLINVDKRIIRCFLCPLVAVLSADLSSLEFLFVASHKHRQAIQVVLSEKAINLSRGERPSSSFYQFFVRRKKRLLIIMSHSSDNDNDLTYYSLFDRYQSECFFCPLISL